jgi:elongation factor G
VAKTFHTAHGGKLSLARVLAGTFADGTTVYGGANDERISGIFTLMGQEPVKRGEAKAGDTVAFGRLDSVKTGDTLSEEKGSKLKVASGTISQPVFGLAIAAKEKKDEVKLTAAIAKIIEEDPSISLSHSQDMGEMVLWGQGEMHLRVALERPRAQIRYRCFDQTAPDPLQGDHPQVDRGARTPQEAIGRTWAVRRRGGDHQAAAARGRLRIQ